MNGGLSNRLARETSPYLLQHARNPVDWYPWGGEALARARREDRPILLSVGYSACHWCHVMERECFENEGIARLMNDSFICIKVDREERPDIDHVYMEAVQAMTGGGGWPLTVFLTPNGEPFYGGTYFPPEDRPGLPGFPRLLAALSEAYRERRSEVAAAAGELASRLKPDLAARAAPAPLTGDILAEAFAGLEAAFDNRHGGFGPGPKFPQPPVLEFLLRYHRRTGSPRALEMVQLTLDRMAAGGIYDHVGGGFHRYATDRRWMVPHFEKMLYDNAQLGRLYLHAWSLTGKAAYRRTAEETLDYLLRDMACPAGGFYSAQDADVAGEEGGYYLWTPGEMTALLGERDGRIAARYFGAAGEGQPGDRSILHVSMTPAALAAQTGESPEYIEDALQRARPMMMGARERRPRPQRDTKILTSWNGLVLQALAEAAAGLGRKDYLAAAEATAGFLAGRVTDTGVLLHAGQPGGFGIPGFLEDYASRIPGVLEVHSSGIPGFLEDYALLACGLLDLHEATLDQRWLRSAADLAGAMVRRFGDPAGPGVLYDTGPDHGDLLFRPRDTADSVKPCGGSAAAEVLLRVSRSTGDASCAEAAAAMLSLVRDQMTGQPLASGHWLCALDLHLADPGEAVSASQRDSPG